MELRHTLHVEMGELELSKENVPEIEDMVSACARFVNVDKKSDIDRLFHYATQEYLEQRESALVCRCSKRYQEDLRYLLVVRFLEEVRHL